MRPQRFWRPRKLGGGGGASAQQEEAGLNSFGATITTDYSTIFNPGTIEDRNFVAVNGYIASKRRDRYIDPIDRVIRAAAPPSETRAKLIEDTSSPTEITRKLRKGSQLAHQALLIVGGAGSGKTTFVDHLRTKALPSDLRQSTSWAHIDMNPAPISRSEIYDWLRLQIVHKCRSENTNVDFDELDTIKAMSKHSGRDAGDFWSRTRIFIMRNSQMN